MHGIKPSGTLNNPRTHRSLDLSFPVSDLSDMNLESRDGTLDESQIDDKQETDYVPPLRFTRAQQRRPDYVPLNMPTRTMPQQMSLTSVVTKTSIREELKVTYQITHGCRCAEGASLM